LASIYLLSLKPIDYIGVNVSMGWPCVRAPSSRVNPKTIIFILLRGKSRDWLARNQIIVSEWMRRVVSVNNKSNKMWSRNCLPFRCTWFHPWFL